MENEIRFGRRRSTSAAVFQKASGGHLDKRSQLEAEVLGYTTPSSPDALMAAALLMTKSFSRNLLPNLICSIF